MWHRIKNLLSVPISALMSLLAAIFLPRDAYHASSELIATFSGFIAAAIVPAMILSATLLKSSGMNLSDFRKYRYAIHIQMDFLTGLLAVTIFLIFFVLLGKVFPFNTIHFVVYHIDIYLYRFENFIITFFLCLLFIRFFNVLTAIRSMFFFHAKTIEKEIKEIQKYKFEKQFETEELPKDTRVDFGKMTEL